MKILFDQGTPLPLRKYLSKSEVITVASYGWSELSNGDLIAAAEKAGFDLLVTTDRNLKYQQNLSNRKISIAVILQSAWPILKVRAAEVAKCIEELKDGSYAEI